MSDTLRGLALVREANDDPEDTMVVALTHRELALTATGQCLVMETFPDLEDVVTALNHKLHELGVAQGFLPAPVGA